MASYIPPLQIWQQMTLSCVILLVLTNTMVNGQQRVVPGINPNHYQQAPPQQAYQHPPAPPQQPHQQHIQSPPGHNPQQYQQYQQQAPVHAQPHQQQHQQQPQFQQHHAPHNHHGQPQQVLNAANINEERAHIQEHMQVPIDTSKMTEQELQFHYFKMHDSDNNNKLDGCELIKSLIHWHDPGQDNHKADHQEQPNTGEHHGEGEEKKETTIYTDETLSQIIDYVLNEMDTNDDGFINYAEYMQSSLSKTL